MGGGSNGWGGRVCCGCDGIVVVAVVVIDFVNVTVTV